jgi:hypothetical protein
MKTTVPTGNPTYTHIVHRPDRMVQHNFSLSGWNETARHAGNIGDYTARGREYKTVCGKAIVIESEYYPNDAMKREETNDLRCDPAGTGFITCNACRKKLGLKPLKKRR